MQHPALFAAAGDPQRLAKLLGRPEPDALVYKILGGLLPEQLQQEEASAVPYYAYQLALYTCPLPGLCESHEQ